MTDAEFRAAVTAIVARIRALRSSPDGYDPSELFGLLDELERVAGLK